MKTKFKKEQIIAATATIFLIAALIGIGVMQRSNKSLQDYLSDARLKTEKLLSEKLSLDKQIDKNNKELTLLNEKNKSLDKMLDDLKQKLVQKEAALKAHNNDGAKIKSLEKQIADIQKQKSELKKQIASANAVADQLRGEIDALTKTNAGLLAENKTLTENAKILTRLAADNFIVQSTKGKKDRLTVNARKTKKLSVGFDVPQNIVTAVSFKVTTPQGKTYTSKDKSGTITSAVVDQGDNLYASLSPLTGEFEVTRRIEMVYKPTEKLMAGIYKIEIYNKDAKLGSCQVKLR